MTEPGEPKMIFSFSSPSGFIPKPNQTLSAVFSQHEIEHYNKKHMLNRLLTTFILAYWYDQEAQIWQLLSQHREQFCLLPSFLLQVDADVSLF